MNERELAVIRQAMQDGNYMLSLHAAVELENDGFTRGDIEAALIGSVVVVEDYPDAQRGACALVLGWIGPRPMHIVVTYPPQVVISVWDPSQQAHRWNPDYTSRRK